MHRTARGFSLLEVMIAMSVLLVGLLGMTQLQIQSLSWNQSARAHTRANELALELRAGLEQLDYTDPRLTPTAGWSATAPPASNFGSFLGATPSSAVTWSDSSPIPGVTLDSQLPADDLAAGPLYRRRWTVWGYSTMASQNAGALVIAISVVYHDKATANPKEVVVYTERVNPATIFANIRVGS